ncbi:hypothetical protein NBRC116597_15230 [Phaeobacter sp. NW0010-22]
MSIANDDVFGPVLSVLKFKADDVSIKIANETPIDLAGGVFTLDVDLATSAARQLRAGQVFVNKWYAGGVETPFGDYGKSGYGRNIGREALRNYVRTKNAAIKLGGRPKSTFDEDLFLIGLEQRKSKLGVDYVEQNLAVTDDFTQPFQEAMTACGFGWGDDVIVAKSRSVMNLSMIGALRKMREWEIHCRGASYNGFTLDEVHAIIHVT